MRLAKPHLDIALFTDRVHEHREFWEENAQIRFDHRLQVREGWSQDRFEAHGSVIKVNDFQNARLHDAPSGYTRLFIARDGHGPAYSGPHPDGGIVHVVPRGSYGVTGIAVVVSTPDPRRMMAFYVDAMQFERVDPLTARCGDSLLMVKEGTGGTESEEFAAQGRGFRYLTVQIYDADLETRGILERGGRLALAPADYGSIARVSFVKDPDGNWIEISARASLTGVLPRSIGSAGT